MTTACASSPARTKNPKFNNQPTKGLPGISEEKNFKDDLSRVAYEFKQASDAVKKAKETLAEKAADLMVEMRRAKRFLIPVDGGSLEMKHEAAKEVIRFVRAKGE